jgi:single-strand DNA-binding protein
VTSRALALVRHREEAMSVNLAVVRGICSSPAEVRELPSGSTLVLLQVTTRHGEEAAISVPVVAWDPPGSVSEFDVGDEVVAVGRVRRRFFRTGAGTGSRVEIEAEAVVPARDRRRVQAAVRRATASLEAVLG